VKEGETEERVNLARCGVPLKCVVQRRRLGSSNPPNQQTKCLKDPRAQNCSTKKKDTKLIIGGVIELLNWPRGGNFVATFWKFNCKDLPCKILNIPPHQLVLTYEDRNYVLRTLLLQLLPLCTAAAMNAYKPMGKHWRRKEEYTLATNAQYAGKERRIRWIRWTI